MTDEKTLVSIAKGNQDPKTPEVEALVREALDKLGDLSDLIAPGKKVLIKPNVADSSCIRADVTDVRVVRAIAKIAKEKGSDVIIAESGSVAQDTEKLFDMCGYHQLREEGWELVDMHKTEETKITLPNPRKEFEELKVYKLPLEVDTIISVPVLKTHMTLLATLSLKNMKGCIPDTEKRKFHLKYGVEEAVAQLNTIVRPHLCIVDGIWAGAASMNPWRMLEEMDIIAAGRDPVAVDTVCSQIMGIDPQDVLHIQYAEELGIGTMDPGKIEVVGRSVEEVCRTFILPEGKLSELAEGLDIDIRMDQKTCTGCVTTIFQALGFLMQYGMLDSVKGLTLVSGMGTDKVPDVPKDKLILVGNCTKQFKDYGRFVEGCPFWPTDMMAEVAGLEIPETIMGDMVDTAHDAYKEKIVQGAPAGFPWDQSPGEAELKNYIN
jgi:uncharacterized protein (DUF362 family)